MNFRVRPRAVWVFVCVPMGCGGAVSPTTEATQDSGNSSSSEGSVGGHDAVDGESLVGHGNEGGQSAPDDGGSWPNVVECFSLCKKLAAGGCGYTWDDCGARCMGWHGCAGWPDAVQCFAAQETYSCQACQQELAVLVSCYDGPTMVDCIPGEKLPSCICDSGSKSSRGLCQGNGKTYACCQ
jgi:hypothetical protein